MSSSSVKRGDHAAQGWEGGMDHVCQVPAVVPAWYTGCAKNNAIRPASESQISGREDEHREEKRIEKHQER